VESIISTVILLSRFVSLLRLSLWGHKSIQKSWPANLFLTLLLFPVHLPPPDRQLTEMESQASHCHSNILLVKPDSLMPSTYSQVAWGLGTCLLAYQSQLQWQKMGTPEVEGRHRRPKKNDQDRNMLTLSNHLRVHNFRRVFKESWGAHPVILVRAS